MKYIRGLFMAWGNFSALPCPTHRWYDDSRKAMLCMLPVVGMVLAGIAMLVWWAFDMAGLSYILTGALITALYFCSTGFIHIDGFMDCCDAILSGRPELEERRRILKSPDVGAFAVICTVLMALLFAFSMMELAQDFSFKKASAFIIIMTISRGIAADHVGKKKAMKTSQYADLGKDCSQEDKDSANDKSDIKFTFGESMLLTIISIAPIVILPNIAILPDILGGYTADNSAYLIYFAAAISATTAVALCVGAYARKQLGGMNGDIAGFMIVTSELAGVVATAIAASLTGF